MPLVKLIQKNQPIEEKNSPVTIDMSVVLITFNVELFRNGGDENCR